MSDNPNIVLTPPPTDTNTEWVVPEPGLYEAFILNVEPVPNKWYEAGDPDNKKFQLLWTLQLDEELLGEPEAQVMRDKGLTEVSELDLTKNYRWSNRGRWYTGTVLGKHPKNKLTLLAKAADPTFSLDTGYVDAYGNSDFDKMKETLIGKYVRVVTDINEVKGDDGKTRRYLKIASAPMRSSKGNVDVAKLLAAQTGGTTSTVNVMDGEDLPY